MRTKATTPTNKRSFAARLRSRIPLLAARPVLFFHIPKCGGSTVTGYLHQQYQPKQIFQIDGQNPKQSIDEFQALSDAIRSKYRLVIGHAAHHLLDYVGDDWISMTVLRDPIDRVVSHYYYACRDERHYLNRKIRDESIGLLEYVSRPLTPEVQNYHIGILTGRSFDEVMSAPQESIDMAFEFLVQRFQIVGFLDELSDAMSRVKKIARFHSEFENNRANKTEGRPKLKQIDPNVLREITALNELDVQLFSRLRRHFKKDRRF